MFYMFLLSAEAVARAEAPAAAAAVAQQVEQDHAPAPAHQAAGLGVGGLGAVGAARVLQIAQVHLVLGVAGLHLGGAAGILQGIDAVAENFFGLLKTELFYLEKFDSIDQLEKAIIDYIDYYNNRRIKLKLNGLSPVQYRIQTVGVA